MQYAQDLLSGEEPIGDHTNDEGSNDGAQALGSVSETRLFTGGADAAFGEVGSHGDEPDPPNKKVQEHHGVELQANGRFHEQSFG